MHTSNTAATNALSDGQPQVCTRLVWVHTCPMVPAVRCSSCSAFGNIWLGSGADSVVANTAVRLMNGLSRESVGGCGTSVGTSRPLT